MKKTFFFSILCSSIALFGAVSLTHAQFQEPGLGDLPAPVSISRFNQSIEGALGLGTVNPNDVPSGVALYVRGAVLTRTGTQVGHETANVLLDENVGGWHTLTVDASAKTVHIGRPCGADVDCQTAKLSVDGGFENLPALRVEHGTTTGSAYALFGQTSASGKAGIYGESPLYGVQGYAIHDSSIAIVGKSCVEDPNDPSVCLSYGSAGYFVGANTAGTAIKIEQGILSGDGRNLFRVKSLDNREPTENTNGIAYRSFTGSTANTVFQTAWATTENIVSVSAVESDSANGIYSPVGNLGTVQIVPGTGVQYKANSAGPAVHFRMVIMYNPS